MARSSVTCALTQDRNVLREDDEKRKAPWSIFAEKESISETLLILFGKRFFKKITSSK